MGFLKDRKEIALKYQQEFLRSQGNSPVPHPKSGIGNKVIVGIILLAVAGAVVNYTSGQIESNTVQDSGKNVDDSYWCKSNPSIPAFSKNCGKPILKQTNSWEPANFKVWSDNPNVAWRWLKGNEFRCTADSCWGMLIIAKEGCTNSLYAELSVLDANNVKIGYTNDSIGSTLPMQKAKMIFNTYEEDAKSATISKISCY